MEIRGHIRPYILAKRHIRHYYALVDEHSFMKVSELQVALGERMRQLRLSKNLDQRFTAEKAGISERALKNLEAGRGSSTETLLRVLKALDSLDGIDMLVPAPTVNPLTLLRNAKVRRRVRRPRKVEP
jgi:DNA-binding XRE family transcriptional regulator